MELFYIDEDGSLINKGSIAQGGYLFRLCAMNQLWALKAKSTIKTTNTSNNNNNATTDASTTDPNNHISVSSLIKKSGDTDGDVIDDNISAHNDEIDYPTLMVIQLTSSSLSNNKCTSIIWTPLYSISVAHRIYANKANSNNRDDDGDDKAQPKIRHKNESFITADPPHMHIQVFDRVENKGASQASSSVSLKIDHSKQQHNKQQYKQPQPPLPPQQQQQQQKELKSDENPYRVEKVKLTKWPKPKRRQHK